MQTQGFVQHDGTTMLQDGFQVVGTSSQINTKQKTHKPQVLTSQATNPKPEKKKVGSKNTKIRNWNDYGDER